LHAQLGFLEQMGGKLEAAIEEYQIALEADPYNSLAAGDLALLRAGRHQYADAARLWNAVFDGDPAQLGAGMNLAEVQCALGEQAAALATLDRLLEFAPDHQKAKALAREIGSGARKCGVQ
jgi:tetratricopeptide (TPR) repeat protein